MTDKKYLESLFILNLIIEDKEEKLSMLRERVCSYNANRLSHTPGATSQGDKLCYQIACLLDKEKQLDKLIGRYVNRRKELLRRIFRIKNKKHRKVLYYRYIKFKEWREIAELVGVSKRHIYKIRSCAIKTFIEKN